MRDLLARRGFEIEDHLLRSRGESDAFKREHRVETTSPTFTDGERVGGYDALRARFGREKGGGLARREDELSPGHHYLRRGVPDGARCRVVRFEDIEAGRTTRSFVAFSMCNLAIQKLQDVASFSNMFLGYGLLAQKQPRYTYRYPYGEALAGIRMIAGARLWIAIPVALFIGTLGSVSVFKTAHIDKLECACAGGNSNVPLGFVTLAETLARVGMALWMRTRVIG